LSALVEHSTDVSTTLHDVSENVTHLMTMMSSWKKEQVQMMSIMEIERKVKSGKTILYEDEEEDEGTLSRRASIVPPTPPRSKAALGLKIPPQHEESGEITGSEAAQGGKREEGENLVNDGDNHDEDEDDRVVESLTPPPAEDQWIRVPGENNSSFYFNTVNKQLWNGDGVPPNVVEAPSLDSPLIPPRKS